MDADFEVSKHEQMRNYSGQLTTGFLEHEGGTVNVRDCSKNVWIVTRGSSRRITKIDSVVVKEVAISDLIKVYGERVESNFGQDQLASALGNIA